MEVQQSEKKLELGERNVGLNCSNPSDSKSRFFGSRLRPMTTDKINQKLRNIFVLNCKKDDLGKLAKIFCNKCQLTSPSVNYQLFGRGLTECSKNELIKEGKFNHMTSIPSFTKINDSKPNQYHNLSKGFRIKNSAGLRFASNRGSSFDCRERTSVNVISQRNSQSKNVDSLNPNNSMSINKNEDTCNSNAILTDTQSHLQIKADNLPNMALCIGATMHQSCNAYSRNIFERYNRNKKKCIKNPEQIKE